MEESEGSNVPYTESEKAKLLKYLKENNIRLYYAVCFVYFCFIRRTELIHLRVGDINMENHTITIHPFSSKTKKSRTATIPTAFEPVLKEMELEKYDLNDFVFGHRFNTCNRRIVKPESLTYAMTRINEKFGIKKRVFMHGSTVGWLLYIMLHMMHICI